MLDTARGGRATSVVLGGAAGIGKTALLDALASRTLDGRILRTVGLQAETSFPFAALHRFLRPVLPEMTRLPEPQRRALRLAFGEREDQRLDPFLVSLATLSMLTEVADQGLVLGLVDDVQWLDAASLDALLFATRRLVAEPVAMVFAARDDDPGYVAPTDVPALVLQDLHPEAVRKILTERSPRPPAEHAVEDLVARAGGNPLAAVEFSVHAGDERLQGSAVLPAGIPISDRVERVFLERCRCLSPPAQTLMLLAAADDSIRRSALAEAGRRLGVSAEHFVEVESARLLVSDGESVSVRHPLVRSAVYQAATTSERRDAHRALAEALAGTDERDRRTWHRAAAADRPDEGLADDLEAAGVRAESRGGHEAACSAYERSADLTIPDPLRARRLFDAARNAYASGRIGRAGALLVAARSIADDRRKRAAIDRLRGRIEVAAGSALDAHRIFVVAARDVAREDESLALEMAALAGVLRSHGVDSGAVLEPGTLSAGILPDDSTRVQCLKLLLTATDRDAANDWAGALEALRAGLAIARETENRDVWANLANMALHLGDDVSHRTLFAAMLTAARVEGAVMEVLYALNRLCFSQLAAGDWSGVRRSADEALSLARSIGQTAQTGPALSWLALLAALQGRDDYDELIESATATLRSNRLGVMDRPVEDVLRWGRATRAAQAGDPAESLHHFEKMQVPAVTRLAAAPRIAAAVSAGRHGLAVEWTDELDEFAAATSSPWARAVVLYGRALLAGGDGAPRLFETSLTEHRAARRPYDAACTELAYGEQLRRGGHRVEARAHLHSALETFRDLEAEHLAARAGHELRASGATARKRNPSTLTHLTPTELRITQLVSRGLSNKEVAEQCWVSPRTVAFHLRNVFTKTGVSSRGELAQLDLT